MAGTTSQLLNTREKKAWNSSKAVLHGFLGNNRVENYKELIETMLKNFTFMDCRMYRKVNMLHAHLEKFKDNNVLSNMMEFERLY